MNKSHSECSHPASKAARAQCRRQQKLDQVWNPQAGDFMIEYTPHHQDPRITRHQTYDEMIEFLEAYGVPARSYKDTSRSSHRGQGELFVWGKIK